VTLRCNSMNLSSLLVCADKASAQVLRGVLEELNIRVELCGDAVRAGVRLAQDHFDMLIVDCEKQSDVMHLLRESYSTRGSGATLAVVVAGGEEKIREMFTLGVNFVLYKPISHERAMTTLVAAQTVLFRDKRRNTRVSVHAQATIDYAGAEQSKATLVDLAEEGMAVNFGKHLPPTCKVYFQFQLPGQTKTIRLSGVVVWQDWSGRAGVHFLDVPQSSKRILSEWLATNVNQASKPEPAVESDKAEKRTTVKVADGIVPASWSEDKPECKDRDREAVARLRSEPGNRRGQTRYACRLGAEVYQRGSSVRNYCHLSDLSPGGCYLEMPVAFPTGAQVEITVRTHDMKLRLSGEVRASHPGYGMGISFKLNTKDERLGVQQLIDFVAATTENN
jgi:CheY-like chemotaxis protein